MAKPKQYEVYDNGTGELLATGTAAECAKVVFMAADYIRRLGRGTEKSSRYKVVYAGPEIGKVKRELAAHQGDGEPMANVFYER